MKSKTKTLFYKKKFLNKKGYHAGAFIFASMTSEAWDSTDHKTKETERKVSVDMTLDIADCSRIISLDLDMYSQKSAVNSLRKLDILIDTMQDFKVAFIKELELKNKNKEKYV